VVDLTEDVEDEPDYSIPSADQRYRSFPPFLAQTSVERLAQEPQPLTQSTTTHTRNGSDDGNIADKVARAWAKNFGPGPTWELMEDRSWFKESYQDPNRFIQRPLVHYSLEDATSWQEIPLERVIIVILTHYLTRDQ
jgi:transcription factor C subunit 6